MATKGSINSFAVIDWNSFRQELKKQFYESDYEIKLAESDGLHASLVVSGNGLDNKWFELTYDGDTMMIVDSETENYTDCSFVFEIVEFVEGID